MSEVEKMPLSGTVERDIVYKEVNGQQICFDRYIPDVTAEGPIPAVIYVHGGGWRSLDKDRIEADIFRPVLANLLCDGVTVFSVNYRLVSEESGTSIKDCVIDVFEAVRFIFQRAQEYNFDPNNLGVWGGSAGGHLSLMCAVDVFDKFPCRDDLCDVKPKINFAANYFPVTNMELLYEDRRRWMKELPMLLNYREQEVPEDGLCEMLSPYHHLRSDLVVKFFSIHGDADIVVDCKHSKLFHEKAQSLDLDSEFVIVAHADHGWRAAEGKEIDPGIEGICEQTYRFISSALH